MKEQVSDSAVAKALASLPADAMAANDLYESRAISVEEGGRAIEFRYRLLAPATIEPGRKYPLVVFLHGAGERGTDNVLQLKYLPAWLAAPDMRAKHACFVLVPQCRMDERWVDVSWADKTSTPQAAEPTTDLEAAMAMLDHVLTDEPVDPDRVYLTGISMGGFGSWDLASRRPDVFAALLPVCGGGDERTAARIADIPAWVAHGDADKAVPVERSRSMVKALEAAGGRPTYVEMPGVGHDAWTPTYRDPAALDWLFAQRRRP
ncbi:MAG: prolyl oligopeptidase family serine peptidase [Planctomycetia bacterium]